MFRAYYKLVVYGFNLGKYKGEVFSLSFINSVKKNLTLVKNVCFILLLIIMSGLYWFLAVLRDVFRKTTIMNINCFPDEVHFEEKI